MFDTSNPHSYQYTTKHLEIHILGGLKTSKLESMRVTLAINKPKSHNVLRHSLDLYNDNQVEKFVRRCAERLEVGTSVVRKTLQELTHELENYRFILLQKIEQQAAAPRVKELTASEVKEAEKLLKKEGLLALTNEYIGRSS